MRRDAFSKGHLSAPIAIGVSLFAILFLAFSWGNALLKDAQLARQIEEFKAENERINIENKRLAFDFSYFSSPQYRDKWAKEHEGVAQPGEKAVVIEFPPEGVADDITKNRALLEREILLSRPNREQWKIFFFGKEDVGFFQWIDADK